MEWIDELVEDVSTTDNHVITNLHILAASSKFSECESKGEALKIFINTLAQINAENEKGKAYSMLGTVLQSESEKLLEIISSIGDTRLDFLMHSEKVLSYLLNIRACELFTTLLCQMDSYKTYKQGFTLLNNVQSSTSDDRKSIAVARSQMFKNYLDFLDSDSENNSKSLQDVINTNFPAGEQPRGLVVVDPDGKKRVENGVFYVDNLVAGLQISKNGGVLYLKNHNYKQENFDIIHVNAKKDLKIIGESFSGCSISGSLRITSPGNITISNIKFEVGDNAESREAINVFSGRVKFESCVFECFVNTAFYISSPLKDECKTEILMALCIFEGLCSCQRVFSIENGCHIVLDIDTCYFNESYSVLTVPQSCDDWRNVSVNFKHSSFRDVQDGLKTSSDSKANIVIDIAGCDFNMDIYNEDEPTNAIRINNAQSLTVRDCFIKYNYTLGAAIFGSRVDQLVVSGCVIHTEQDLDRKLSTFNCVSLENINKAELSSTEMLGARIGLYLNACDTTLISKCRFKQCSVGVYTPQFSCLNNLSYIENLIEYCFDGIIIEGIANDVTIKDSKFLDVINPVLSKEELDIKLENCAKEVGEELKSRTFLEQADIETNEALESDSVIAPILHMDGNDIENDELDGEGQKPDENEMNGHLDKEDGNVPPNKIDDNDTEEENITDDDLKLYLIVKKNLPYQVAVENRGEFKEWL